MTDAITAAVQAKRALEFRYRSMPWQDGKMPIPDDTEIVTAVLAAAGAALRADIADEITAICAETVLEAVAAERERIRQLATETGAWYERPCSNPDCDGHTEAASFTELLASE
jgi:L-alanine-DL-glutamate epimerase-like enolase superfamily enzyme